jgi:lipoic acid synthetase
MSRRNHAQEKDTHQPSSSRKLNVLPPQPVSSEVGVSAGRFPAWLHRKMPSGNALLQTHGVLDRHRLPTVCEEAKCPNLFECYAKKTATFLAMGKECTRNCGFCSIDFSKQPKALEEDEPLRLASSVKSLGLRHVVITMVARDDLEDGGAAHLAKILQVVREENPGVTVEILTSDFKGDTQSYDKLIEAKPEIFNHNIETVRSLSARVRHKATYERTLTMLHYISRHLSNGLIKSGLMVGLGEKDEEVKETICDLFEAGVSIITIGHYLQPSRQKLRVKDFISPEKFKEYERYGLSIGVRQMYCGPFIRSSYNADTIYQTLKNHG